MFPKFKIALVVSFASVLSFNASALEPESPGLFTIDELIPSDSVIEHFDQGQFMYFHGISFNSDSTVLTNVDGKSAFTSLSGNVTLDSPDFLATGDEAFISHSDGTIILSASVFKLFSRPSEPARFPGTVEPYQFSDLIEKGSEPSKGSKRGSGENNSIQEMQYQCIDGEVWIQGTNTHRSEHSFCVFSSLITISCGGGDKTIITHTRNSLKCEAASIGLE